MRLILFNNSKNLAQWTAQRLIDRIKAANPCENRPFVLVLPTGSTPLQTYQAFITLSQQQAVDFSHVITFNLDEYLGLSRLHPESYHQVMQRTLFRYIDIPQKNTHLLNGQSLDVEKTCQRYEDLIAYYGGIDLVLAGVGSHGHIAFNETGSQFNSRTRLVTLAPKTRHDNARFFNNNINQVPPQALTMGIGTLLEAKEIWVLATGKNKALAIKHTLEEKQSIQWPISALQRHPNVQLICDQAATKGLQKRTLEALNIDISPRP